MFKVGIIVAIIVAIFSIGYKLGRDNEKNKIKESTIEVLKEYKKNRERVSKIPSNALDRIYRKLYETE